MNYIVDIIDTDNNTHVLSLEKAERESIVLNYQGADRGDELGITGSSLDFSMIYQGLEDGHFNDLFTGNETRFKVRLYDELNVDIWNGFLLPDSYSEPFSHTQIVNFQATDGLGRLKGKFLPDDYYKDEKSVIQVITQCLKLTGLELEFRFAPAIENSVQKDYNLIYVDTLNLIKNGKKQDSYRILDDLLSSMLCSIYQAENYFNIEGLNIRQQRVYNTKIYSALGSYIEEQTITRNRKEITGVATPNVSMQAPYGVVEVNHERELLGYDDEIYKEENDGWVTYNVEDPDGINGIYPTAWFGFNGAYLKVYDNTVLLPRETAPDQYMIPREKLYVEQYQKYDLTIDFKYFLDVSGLFDRDLTNQKIDEGFYDNQFDFEVSVLYKSEFGVEKRKVLYSNDPQYIGEIIYKRQRPEKDDFNQVLNLNFIPTKSGVLEIKLGTLEPFGIGAALIGNLGVGLNEIILEKIGQKEDEFFSNILAEDYTLKKEVDLEYSDDNTGLSKSFILQKLRLNGDSNFINIPIIRKFQFQGFYYAVVSLRGANLIKDNPDVFNQFLSGTVKLIDVIYNYNGSQEHVIKTSEEVTFDLVTDIIYDTLLVTENRNYWQQWSDTYYKIEQDRYAQSVLNIYNRAYNRAIPVIQDFTLKNNVKLNDFIIFPYLNKTEWICNNCKWYIDTGYSTVSMSQRYYVVSEGELLPPTVEAIEDIYFNGEDTNTLDCKAFDPDGFIVSYKWREITNNGAKFITPNSRNTIVYNLLDADYYEFEITVTDNDGLTATDTVKAYRNQNAVVSFDLVYTNLEWRGNAAVIDEGLEEHYKFICDPDISEGTAINLKGYFRFKENSTDDAFASYEIVQNGSTLVFYDLIARDEGDKEFSVNYIKGDEIIFKLSVGAIYNAGSDSAAEIEVGIDEIEFVEGVGQITGYPITALCKITQA